MTTFQDIISSMPVGLERSLGRILSQRVGKGNAIDRDELLALLREQPGCKRANDRTMRLKIEAFRKKGVRICHFEQRVKDEQSGKLMTVRGYYLAANDVEYNEFRQWLLSYANTIWQTVRSMDARREVLTPEGLVEPPPGMEVQSSLFAM